MIVRIIGIVKFKGEVHMVQEDYMLMLGANTYASPEYRVFYQADSNAEKKTNLFCLESTESGLNLTTEIQDENSDLIAKINNSKPIQINEKFDLQGKIEEGNGLTLTRKDDGAIILNARIIEDGYVAVTGIFHIGGKKIHIADRTVEIDDMPRQTINGVNMHDSIFIGTAEITLTNEGIKLSSEGCNQCGY